MTILAVSGGVRDPHQIAAPRRSRNRCPSCRVPRVRSGLPPAGSRSRTDFQGRIASMAVAISPTIRMATVGKTPSRIAFLSPKGSTVSRSDCGTHRTNYSLPKDQSSQITDWYISCVPREPYMLFMAKNAYAVETGYTHLGSHSGRCFGRVLSGDVSNQSTRFCADVHAYQLAQRIAAARKARADCALRRSHARHSHRLRSRVAANVSSA